MPYDPEVNDYVVWNTPMGLVHKGWVYFKCEDYITIEIGVKLKNHIVSMQRMISIAWCIVYYVVSHLTGKI